MSDQKTIEASWIEELYRYAEYYHGERQHLTGPREEVRERMRRTEVPLNAILNITLRLLPDSSTGRLLGIFLTEPRVHFGSLALTRLHPDDAKLRHTVQPDVSLESETARVFIELKVSARCTLQQVQKYVLLHALRNNGTGAGKVPFLLFLSPRRLYNQWEPGERDPVFAMGKGPEGLLEHLRATAFPEKLGSHRLAVPDQEQVSQVLSTLRVGATTWQSFGEAVHAESVKLQSGSAGEAENTLCKLLDDLLADLDRRGLCKTNQRR